MSACKHPLDRHLQRWVFFEPNLTGAADRSPKGPSSSAARLANSENLHLRDASSFRRDGSGKVAHR